MGTIKHVSFSWIGCEREVSVAHVRCDACSRRRGVTAAQWKFLRTLVANNEMACEIVDAALKDLETFK